MAEQSPFSTGDEVFIMTSEGDARTGVVNSSNADTANEKLLYTIKLENSFWVGSANRVFPKETSVEEAMELLRDREEEQSQQLIAQQAKRDEEEQRLAAAAAEEVVVVGEEETQPAEE
ncbi:hypothetical protein H8E77_37765 [bacterium]|nr:hypothetical protein [bacterium]